MDVDREQSIKKLRDLIKQIRVAMLTTVAPDGSLHSRPMVAQEVEFDGDLWFFTGTRTPKMNEIKANEQVGVSYANTDNSVYVSVIGKAEVVNDRKKIKDLWNPAVQAWFPRGSDDPDVALIKVVVERAEYWESPGGKMEQLVGFVKALATGERYDKGENRKIEVR